MRVRRERIYVRRRRVALACLTTVLAGSTAAVLALKSDRTPPTATSTSRSASSEQPTLSPNTTGNNVYGETIRQSAMSPAVSGDPERVYVPNSESGTVDVIDPTSFKVVARYRTSSYAQHITPSWDLSALYVNNTHSNSLTVLDPRSGRPTGVIPVPDPYNLYFTPDGSKAIVVAEGLQRLDFRDPRSFALIKSVRLPTAGPDHLDFSADGRYLLVSTEFGGHVYRVDTRAMKVTGVASVGGLPIDVKLAPDGKAFFVANQGLGGVSVIDPVRMRQIRFVRTGKGAHGLAISTDTTSLYVSDRLAGSIAVIDFSSERLVRTWRLGGSPDMMQVSPDGSQLWVSNRFSNTVSVVSTITGRVLTRIRVGRGPHGLTYFPQPGDHSLGHNGVYR